MPRRSKKAPDLDWDRVAHMQNDLPSGKDKNSKGGNFRANPRRYDENFDNIKSTCRKCGRDKQFGKKCQECED